MVHLYTNDNLFSLINFTLLFVCIQLQPNNIKLDASNSQQFHGAKMAS